MQRLSEKQRDVLKLIQEVNEQTGVSLDSYKERFETLSYLTSEALDIEPKEFDKIIIALENYGYLEDFELTVDGEQYLEVGVQETMSVNIGNVNFNGKNQKITVGDDKSVEQKGVFVSVDGNTVTPNAKGVGAKIIEKAGDFIVDKIKGE